MKRKFNPLRNAGRLKTIAATFAKHGFQSVVERVKLGRGFAARFSNPEIENMSAPERLRRCFEELGPVFVKFGQMLASRPDLIPADFYEEFRKLQDQVPSFPRDQIERVLSHHFGGDLKDVFEQFEDEPLAAASIAQVHRAVLRTGEPVVVKIQRPGLDPLIEEDLAILFNLAELIEKYIPEYRRYHPKIVVEEFARSLAQETNFTVEANNLRRFALNFAEEAEIHIPKVFLNLSGRRVLVMEELKGTALSQTSVLPTEKFDPQVTLKTAVRAYLKMVFIHGLFHGDLHAGNIFIMPQGQIGFVDFGAVGRLNRRTQMAVAEMLMALADEDYERLAFTYVELAPISEEADVDEFARQLRDLIAPYFGLTLRNINIGRLMLESTTLAYAQGLVLPADLVLFFKSLMAIEGAGRLISQDFDLFAAGLEFANELLHNRLDPKRVAKELGQGLRDLNVLLSSAPRQLRQVMRRLGRPDFKFNIDLVGLSEYQESRAKGDRIRFLGMIAASLVLTGGLIMVFNPNMDHGLWWSLGFFGLAAWISSWVLFFFK